MTSSPPDASRGGASSAAPTGRTTADPHARTVVVGAGAFGAAAAWELARRGHPVLLLDLGPLPHPDASSTDISKVVRMDYGADVFYARLAERALAGWADWNVRAGAPLYHATGFLLLSREPLRPGGFEHDSLRTVEALGHPVERLDGGRVEARFPGWSGARYPDGYLSLHAGWAESGRAVAWMLAQARAAGVEVREGVRVSGLLERGSRVAGVRTEDGDSIEAARVVVAAGAWTPVLLPWLADRLRVVGQPVFHLRPRDAAAYAAERFPPWAADIARTGWYGFPAAADGIVKVANHGAGVPVDPRARPDVPAVWEAHLRDFLVDARPDLADAHIAARRLCLYCDAFDGDFWIAADPAREGLVVAAGGSGHGFKFAPVLGEIVANVLEGRPDEWAPRFAWREAGARRREAARWDPERPTT